uniref:Amino acid transporter transmembrane domain-containing protein n=1 Tax=Kalanchoe fedtschenkoi TaxID=63787 RepID=A0A7N0V1W9_KALFE
MPNTSSVSIQQVTPRHQDEIQANFEDDDHDQRTGNLWTAIAHIITAVIGSGVLSLAWAVAQLGWVAGPAVMMGFAVITFFTSTMMADSHRHPSGRRNRIYKEVVQSFLGAKSVKLCGWIQYSNLVGITVGYTITGSISMVAVNRSNCFHSHGHQHPCHRSNYPYMAAFGVSQLVLSQIPNFHKLSWLSTVAAVMSFTYSTIALGLSLAQIVGGGPKPRTTITGTVVGVDVGSADKVWRMFQAIGNMAFAFTFSNILVEIQNTLRSNPPENKVMKKASLISIILTTIFYVLCGMLGYAAFGNDAPGNFLTGFGFYEPFWLIDFANVCIAVHLIGAYQVFAQPLFAFVEEKCNKMWPKSSFITADHHVRLLGCVFPLNNFRLVWRSVYVVITALLAMIFPFFNDILGIIGALSFYPLTVYFPIEIYIARTKIKRFSSTWICLEALSMACLAVSAVAVIGSVKDLALSLKRYKPFSSEG